MWVIVPLFRTTSVASYYKFYKEEHNKGDFEHFYTVFERHVIGRNSFGLETLPIEFKDELNLLYQDILLSNTHSSEVQELVSYFGNLDSNFEIKLEDRLKDNNNIRELNALSVLEYSKYFWSKFQ